MSVSTYSFSSIGSTAQPTGVANWCPNTATSGVDTFGISTTTFVTSLWLPSAMTVTGVSFLIGSVGGTNSALVSLYDASGNLLANSALAGVTVGTAANIQALPFTATYAASGPATLYVGLQYNGGTAKLRTVPAFCQAGIFGGSVLQTFGTPAAITVPTTFTASLAPVVFLY